MFSYLYTYSSGKHRWPKDGNVGDWLFDYIRVFLTFMWCIFMLSPVTRFWTGFLLQLLLMQMLVFERLFYILYTRMLVLMHFCLKLIVYEPYSFPWMMRWYIQWCRVLLVCIDFCTGCDSILWCRLLMWDNLLFLWLVGYQIKILHMCCQLFAAILRNCWPTLVKGNCLLVFVWGVFSSRIQILYQTTSIAILMLVQPG